jgi:hypothetical protein
MELSSPSHEIPFGELDIHGVIHVKKKKKKEVR